MLPPNRVRLLKPASPRSKLQGNGKLLYDDAILDQVEAQLKLESRPGHIRVVNATGTILHTNLGRALLSQSETNYRH